MEPTKLEMSVKPVKDVTLSTYKQIPENDMEEKAILQSKNIVKAPSTGSEKDGADEKMLPESDTKITEKSNINTSDVKFVSNEKQNGDAKVDIGEIKTAFVGMGKEELMKYANDPFWIRLRWFLFIAFWLTWVAMLVGAILIIVAAPKCSPPEPRTWWEQGPFTEIEIDTNETELQQLKDKGIQGVIVTWPDDAYKPITELDSFIGLLESGNNVGINLIVDLKPGVSNTWFNKSEREGEEGEYSDYYIWGPPAYNTSGALIEPNNWKSEKNVSAWKLSQVRKRYYLSPEDVPQLNFLNPKVVDEFSQVITNFIDMGVKGIRLSEAHKLLVDGTFQNEEILKSTKDAPNYGLTDYGFYTHTHTEYVTGLGPLLKQWRDIVKNETEDRPFMLKKNLKSLDVFKVNDSLMIDLPARTKVFGYNKYLSASQINANLDLEFMFLENDLHWPLWQHNTTALPSDVLDIVIMLLRGTPLVSKNANISRELLDIRASPSVMFGNTSRYLLANESCFAFTRITPGNPGYLVVLNPTTEKVTVNLKTIPKIPDEVTVKFISKNFNEDVEVKKKTDAGQLPISPESAIVVSYVP